MLPAQTRILETTKLGMPVFVACLLDSDGKCVSYSTHLSEAGARTWLLERTRTATS